MKNILFSLVALICSMSMNAQIMKIYNGETLVAKYKANQVTHVVFEEEPSPEIAGTAKRTGDIDVDWVQLWKDGPRFAEYNVGAESNKAEDYGGYYTWGGNQDRVDDHHTGTEPLTGLDDTATNLWGINWRMPTQAELQALIDNCDIEWTTVNGVNGRKFTGKGTYVSNSVFFPASGYFDRSHRIEEIRAQNREGYYWTSTPSDSGNAYFMGFHSGTQVVDRDRTPDHSFSVRAVLAE